MHFPAGPPPPGTGDTRTAAVSGRRVLQVTSTSLPRMSPAVTGTLLHPPRPSPTQDRGQSEVYWRHVLRCGQIHSTLMAPPETDLYTAPPAIDITVRMRSIYIYQVCGDTPTGAPSPGSQPRRQSHALVPRPSCGARIHGLWSISTVVKTDTANLQM